MCVGRALLDPADVQRRRAASVLRVEDEQLLALVG